MQQESGLFVDLPEEEGPKTGFYDFKLLKTTAYSRLYVALKQGRRVLIKTTKDNSEWQLRLLWREYELSKNCDHPHLVHIYDFDPELPMGAALIMEYIEGRTLDAYLAERPTSRDRKRLFGELLSAVDYLHQRGIIHNDLKPENILITRANNTLKVIDFGLADSDAEYALRTLGCTPHYASPELRERRQTVDARSDIYSLGCLLGELFPHRYRAVVRRAMAECPEQRYADVASLRRAWMRVQHLPRRLLIGFVIVLSLVWLGWESGSRRLSERYLQAQCGHVESSMDQLCREAIDSMAPIPFYNWTELIGWEFEARIDSCQARALRHFAHERTRSAFEQFCTSCAQKAKARITQASWEGGKLYIHQTATLSPEEHAFYDSLFFAGAPYRPYSGE